MNITLAFDEHSTHIEEDLYLRHDFLKAIKIYNIDFKKINEEMQKELNNNNLPYLFKLLMEAFNFTNYKKFSSESEKTNYKLKSLNVASIMLSSVIFNNSLFLMEENEDALTSSTEKIIVQIKSNYRIQIYSIILHNLNEALFALKGKESNLKKEQEPRQKQINSAINRKLNLIIDQTIEANSSSFYEIEVEFTIDQRVFFKFYITTAMAYEMRVAAKNKGISLKEVSKDIQTEVNSMAFSKLYNILKVNIPPREKEKLFFERLESTIFKTPLDFSDSNFLSTLSKLSKEEVTLAVKNSCKVYIHAVLANLFNKEYHSRYFCPNSQQN